MQKNLTKRLFGQAVPDKIFGFKKFRQIGQDWETFISKLVHCLIAILRI